MSYTRRAIIVIKASDRLASNNVSRRATLDPIGGSKTFTVPLVPISAGAPPATHYWCGWQVTQAQWDELWSEFREGNGKRQSRMYDGDVWNAEAVLADMGLMRQAAGE